MAEPSMERFDELQRRYCNGELGRDQYRLERRRLLDALLQEGNETAIMPAGPRRGRSGWRWVLLALLVLVTGVWLARVLLVPGH